MRILLIADYEEKELWGEWSAIMADKLSKVELILSAGDLNTNYLEFLTDKLRVPLVYVPGNHDYNYGNNPPRRCINADGKIIDLRICQEKVRIIGVGGSMRYKEGPFQFSEEEQRDRVKRVLKQIDADKSTDETFRIMLTHAPCKNYGDMRDLAHRGFNCFNEFLQFWKPKIHCYGHVHEEYNSFSSSLVGNVGFNRLMAHPSGAHLINGYGHCFIEI